MAMAMNHMNSTLKQINGMMNVKELQKTGMEM